MENIHIFGEIHNNPQSIIDIENYLLKIKPNYILHELLYEDICLNNKIIHQRLLSSSIGGICDPSLNEDIYKLGLQLSAKLIGIDIEVCSLLSLKEQFKLREEHMINTIENYINYPNIVIIVGDTHLREKESLELGIPHLHNYLKTFPNLIIRTPISIGEIQ